MEVRTEMERCVFFAFFFVTCPYHKEAVSTARRTEWVPERFLAADAFIVLIPPNFLSSDCFILLCTVHSSHRAFEHCLTLVSTDIY